MKRVHVFLAVGFEEVEAVTVIDLVRRAGIEVITVSISDSKEVEGAHGIVILADKTYAEAEGELKNFASDMLILPGGGQGVENLKAHAPLNELLVAYNSRNKHLAAICAAPSVLGKLKLLKGKKASSYPGFEEQLLGADTSFDAVSQDGNITTSRGAGTAIAFSLKITEVLAGPEVSEKIKDEIIY